MIRAAYLALAAAALLAVPRAGLGAAPYFPYEKIDSYYGQPPASPSQPPPAAATPAPPPAPRTPPAPPKPRQELPPEAPGPSQAAPEFLFPKELGFGVAIGVPYDLVYLDKSYYLWRDGAWQRSASFRGPWKVADPAHLPKELGRHSLAGIREARNREFQLYWKDREHYRGKKFRPGAKPEGGARPGAPGNGKGKGNEGNERRGKAPGEGDMR